MPRRSFGLRVSSGRRFSFQVLVMFRTRQIHQVTHQRCKVLPRCLTAGAVSATPFVGTKLQPQRSAYMNLHRGILFFQVFVRTRPFRAVESDGKEAPRPVVRMQGTTTAILDPECAPPSTEKR